MAQETRIRAAVIGSPISHSLSPVIHRTAADFLGIQLDYQVKDITQKNVGSFLDKILDLDKGSSQIDNPQSDSWVGLSVTMPLKEKILDFVPMTQRSWTVQQLLVANTLVHDTADSLHPWKAYNTDIKGICEAISFQTQVPAGSTWLILGSGASAKSALKAASLCGANRAIVVVRQKSNRTTSIESLSMLLGLDLKIITYADIDTALINKTQVCISTLPAHAADSFAHLFEGHVLADKILLDIAYDPWPSKLAKAWESGEATVISGKYMLVFQAIEQVLLFYPQHMKFYENGSLATAQFQKALLSSVGLD